jgi:hypothetical protein
MTDRNRQSKRDRQKIPNRNPSPEQQERNRSGSDSNREHRI